MSHRIKQINESRRSFLSYIGPFATQASSSSGSNENCLAKLSFLKSVNTLCYCDHIIHDHIMRGEIIYNDQIDFQFHRCLCRTAPDHADHGVLLEGRVARHPGERRHQVGHDVRGQLDPRFGKKEPC